MFQRGGHTDSEAAPSDRARREPTILGLDPVRAGEPFGDVFRRVFPRLSELHASFTGDGVLAAAVWGGDTVADYVHVPLESEPEFIVLGRHDACDLSLARDAAVSLRHALVGVRAAGGELRVRLIDLRSGLGFLTEDGRRCEALAADGPLFARAAGYHLFFLPTGSLSPWPWGRTADETWDTFPERVYRDCRLPSRAPEALRRDPMPQHRPRSVITRIVEPPGELRPFRAAPGARGRRVATIELSADSGAERFIIHEADLARGLLVGRYERCQLGAADENLSRVHLLVIEDGGAVWAVDTASTNGTVLGGERIRGVRLHGDSALLMGRAVTLTWRPE